MFRYLLKHNCKFPGFKLYVSINCFCSVASVRTPVQLHSSSSDLLSDTSMIVVGICVIVVVVIVIVVIIIVIITTIVISSRSIARCASVADSWYAGIAVPQVLHTSGWLTPLPCRV